MTAVHVLLYVKRHPGCTCTEIAGAFMTSCTIAGAHLRALRDVKAIISRGNTRGTRYYPRRGAR
jgi:predicted transcriptional regulator